MDKFIAYSDSSKKILNIAQMASGLPVNVMIIGQEGVGKKLLAKQVVPTAVRFDAKTLEHQLIKGAINIEEYQEIIVTNIDEVINKEEFMINLAGIKVVATSKKLFSDIQEQFAIKIEVPSLEERKEDLKHIIEEYSNEAQEIYGAKCDISFDDLDLSANGVSLKKSIFKKVYMNSLTASDIEVCLRNFIRKELKHEKEYKELLAHFERPLLLAAQDEFKSQLQMANKLKINRVTLRKKIENYLG